MDEHAAAEPRCDLLRVGKFFLHHSEQRVAIQQSRIGRWRWKFDGGHADGRSGESEADARREVKRRTVGSQRAATDAEFVEAQTIEAKTDLARRTSAIDPHLSNKLRLEPAPETIAGKVVSFAEEGAEMEKFAQDGGGLRRAFEQQPEIQQRIRIGGDFRGRTLRSGMGFAKHRGEHLVEDGDSLVQRARGGGRWVDRCLNRSDEGEFSHGSETQSQ